MIKEYFYSLIKQLKEDLPLIKQYDSIYIGGGTPSFVPAKFYEEIFKLLPKAKEVTIEANPNSATKEWLKNIKALGVNRISFGVQSFNDEKLRFLTRIHDKQEAISAIENAFNAGFNNISADLIYNTELDSQTLLDKELKEIEKLPLSHVSAYSLTIEEGTPFSKAPQKQKEDLELSLQFTKKLDTLFKQYEISNYGKESIHNRGYWEYKEYLGIGAGAVGRVGNQRLYPYKSLKEYIKTPHHKRKETLSDKDIKEEKIFLGLRSNVGIEKLIFSDKELAKAELLVGEKKLSLKDEKLYNKDYFLADEIAIWISQ